MRRLPFVALLLVALAAIAGCSSSSSAPGWTYAPAASITPAPSGSGSASPSSGASGSPSSGPSASTTAAPNSSSPAASSGGTALTVTAHNGAGASGFDPKTLEAPANKPFTVTFDNQDTTTSPHNWVLKDSTGTKVQVGGDTSFFSAPAKRDYQVPALKAGTYSFMCEVHPAVMTGTLTVK